ncbi:hypothetical protein N0V93_010228 [Gnomoniopsis smithogilvyi]|uniref:Uncharacterized protein n=1 Tax=Gnomoniopsis smithogilvyi TaxID=1191159 RepID=A0A9W9CT73_9PEZI|nr:hypothetical protein N0V93_010228 [Gnomoniopsis smithogilvyi]
MISNELPITQALLARAHSPASADRIYSEKIQHRAVFLRPTSPPPRVTAKQARRTRRERKLKDRNKALKPKPLSAKQRRKLGFYRILGSEMYTGGQGAAAKLSAADFHGAEVEVVRSACVGRVGIKGIVTKETRFVLDIITADNNAIKTVPKEGTIFRVEVPCAAIPTSGGQSQLKDLVFELLGDQLTVRPAERANRKFKQHFLRKM